jgi:hypothetical protein
LVSLYGPSTIEHAAITQCGASNIARKPYIGRGRILDIIDIPTHRYIFDEMAVFLFTTLFQRYPVVEGGNHIFSFSDFLV